MKKFIDKYINRFKEIKEKLNPTTLKPQAMMAGGQFCGAKALIPNSALWWYSLREISHPLTGFTVQNAAGNLVINGNAIEHYYNMNENFGKIVAYYLYSKEPNKDARNFYFKRVDDLKNVNSYPTLPTSSSNKYAGWVEGKNEVHVNSSGLNNNPACVEVMPNITDYTPEDFWTARPDMYPNDNLSNYSKPGYSFIFFERGFALALDFSEIKASQYPDLSIYDGQTPNPNSSSGANYPRWSYKKWLTSSSDYPDANGVMQSTTPYTAYSWKDFLYRLKSHAENPTMYNGSLQYPWRLIYYGSSNYYAWVPYRYRAYYIGINVDMSPQEVYNHAQRLMTGTQSNNIVLTGNFTTVYTGSVSPSVAYGGPNPFGTQIGPGIPWVAKAFVSNSDYAYALYNLPSSISQGISNFSAKIKQLGEASMHNLGVENCTGCTSGCFWDFKTDTIKCSEVSNHSWPFKNKESCENYLTLYNDSPCPKGSTIEDPVLSDDDNIVISPFNPNKEIWRCNSNGNCTYDGVIPVSQANPANTYNTFQECKNNCICLSECCKREKINGQIYNLPPINFCISSFYLERDEDFYNSPVPSNYQAYPNQNFSVGEYLRWKFCGLNSNHYRGYMLERLIGPVPQNLSTANWQFILANTGGPGAGTGGSVNVIGWPGLNTNTINSAIYRVSLFGTGLIPKANLDPTGHGGGYPMPGGGTSNYLLASELIDQAYIQLESTGTLTPTSAPGHNPMEIFKEVPLSMALVKFPSCMVDGGKLPNDEDLSEQVQSGLDDNPYNSLEPGGNVSEIDLTENNSFVKKLAEEAEEEESNQSESETSTNLEEDTTNYET